MKYLFLILSTIVLMGCEDSSDLPKSGKLQDLGEVNAPYQAKDFCARNPEFDKCK